MDSMNLIHRFNSLRKIYIEHASNFYNKKNDIVFEEESALMGGIKPNEALALAETLLYLRPKKILEIGSFLGLSTRWIMEVTESWGATLTSLDPAMTLQGVSRKQEHLKSFCADYMDRIVLINAFASMGLPQYPDIPIIAEPFDEFDFAFIDGDHSFDLVAQNHALVASMMPQGGIIVGHDSLSWADVIPATETFVETSPALDYRIINRREAPLDRFSLFNFKQWNRQRIARKRLHKPSAEMLDHLNANGADGLTLTHISKDYQSEGPRLKKKKIYDGWWGAKQNSMMLNRERCLNERLLKMSLKDQLRAWGYQQG